MGSRGFVSSIRTAFLVLFFPVLFFLVLELFLRFAWIQPPPNFSRPLFTEQNGHKILIQKARGTNYGREFSVEVAGNQYGYREGTWPKEPVSGKVVWLFGDSFAFGWGVEARDTFAAKLNEQGLAVYDLGIPGDGWKEYRYRLEWAKEHLLKPDLILVVTYDNDFAHSQNTIFKNNLAKSVFDLRRAMITSQTGLLIKRICYHLGLWRALAPWLGSEMNVRAAYGRDFSVHQKNYLDSFPGQMKLAEMEQFVEAAGMVSQNRWIVRITPGYCNGLSWQEEAVREVGKPKDIYDFNRLDQELARICKKHSVQFFKFSPKTDSETQDYYFRYDLHLTSNGHKALADELQKLKL